MYYVKIDPNFQKQLLKDAILKAGSERKLKKELNFPLIMIYFYKNAIHKLPLYRFDLLLQYIGLNKKDISFELINSKEFRKIGGELAYKKSKSNNTFDIIHKKMRKSSSKRMKIWHKIRKEKDFEKYSKQQYEFFKKISNYKIKTKSDLFVRNWLEKEVADELTRQKLCFEYEPYIRIGNKCYFPDFKICDTLIECTAWRGKDKATKLKEKIIDFESNNFRVFVVIPKALRCFYKLISKNIIYLEELSVCKEFTQELGLSANTKKQDALVAQTEISQ